MTEKIEKFSGGATLWSGCSQEHPELKKKKILYIIINFFYLFTLKKKKRNTLEKKLGTLSKKK